MQPLGGPPAVPIDATAARKAPSVRLQEDENEDLAFALWCFLQDLNDIRTFIHSTWQEYARGEVSPLAAAVSTNAGCTLMRQADADFIKAYPAFCEYWHLHDFLKLRLVMQPGLAALMPSEDGARAGQYQADVSPAALLCTSGAIAVH